MTRSEFRSYQTPVIRVHDETGCSEKLGNPFRGSKAAGRGGAGRPHCPQRGSAARTLRASLAPKRRAQLLAMLAKPLSLPHSGPSPTADPICPPAPCLAWDTATPAQGLCREQASAGWCGSRLLLSVSPSSSNWGVGFRRTECCPLLLCHPQASEQSGTQRWRPVKAFGMANSARQSFTVVPED